MPSKTRFVSRRVLIVDNDKDSAQALGTLLRSMGNSVRIAHDGPGALRPDPDFKPDIVLIDLGSNGMDPNEVARAVRAQYPQKKLILVRVSPWSPKAEAPVREEASFSYHLQTPADELDLEAMFGVLRVAKESAAAAARKWVVKYQRGIITEDEFVIGCFRIAGRHDPAEMARVIPEELLDHVRDWAASPPGDVSGVGDWWLQTLPTEEIQILREDTYEGWWRWFRNVRG